MTVESVTQAVSNLALQFGEEDADPGAMVSHLAHFHAEIISLPHANVFTFVNGIMFDGIQVTIFACKLHSLFLFAKYLYRVDHSV